MEATLDLIGTPLAVILTVMVLLYAFGDNPFFRMATYLFIGAAAGYAGAVVLKDVLIPRLSDFTQPSALFALLWAALILTKISPQTAVLGNPGSALLVGVGSAIIIGGAIQGTLLPQISGASDFYNRSNSLWFLQGTTILIGTVTSLIYFHFGAKQSTHKIPQRNRIINLIAKIGQVFISITLGVVFAGIYSAALAALINRADFVIQYIWSFIPPSG